ncbi:CASP-like protein 4D1 [Phragmites australis]|uniref:CASP-like protein 4D1 n=1 Tax=Phragmites australis TaxID=29695 RepID=UPI002D799FE3|nr:CASP-like protein 4D1 [Phragmites australis]
MASSERALAVAALLLRVLTLLLLIASLIIIATDKIYSPFTDVEDPPNMTFRDFYAYRYVLSVAVIGCAYTLLVIPFAAIHVSQGKRIGHSRATSFLIFTDVVCAVLIATGAAAGLGLTVEFQRYPQNHDFKNFLNLVDASCGLLLGATVCMVIMIMISVHSLT